LCSWLTIVVCAVIGVPWMLTATFTRAIEQLFGCLLANLHRDADPLGPAHTAAFPAAPSRSRAWPPGCC
jgi:hypothetical protein